MYAIGRGRKRGWETNACKYGERAVGKQTCANRGRRWGGGAGKRMLIGRG